MLRISIHAPRTGSDGCVYSRLAKLDGISIHAPRTGSDRSGLRKERKKLAISIHAPRTGSDAESVKQLCMMIIFQSTLPARGAT